MHRFTSALAGSALLLSATGLAAQDQIPLDTNESKGGYAIGYNSVQQLIQQGVTAEFIDPEAYLAGVRDAFAGQDSRLADEDLEAIFGEIRTKLQEAQQAAEAERGAKALAEGQAFLEQNATGDGITVTESGLQYRITKEGEGSSPTIDQSVTVHYEGRLLTGDIFDSSLARGAPASFPVSGVIPGWTEALQLMKPGGEWEVWIPSELAYGPRGTGGIGPNEVLNFTIQLISVDG